MVPTLLLLTADPLTMEERALAPAARQALLHHTAKQPVTAAVLWLTCAHVAAYTTLPSHVIHRQVAVTLHCAQATACFHLADILLL